MQLFFQTSHNLVMDNGPIGEDRATDYWTVRVMKLANDAARYQNTDICFS